MRLPRPMTYEEAKQVTARLHRAKTILNEEAAAAKLTPEHLLGECKRHVFVVARHEAMRRLRDELGWSFPRIARFMGRKDHTTAIHGVRAARERNRTQEPTQ